MKYIYISEQLIERCSFICQGTLRKHRRSSSGVFSRAASFSELSLLSVQSQTRSSQRKRHALTPFSGTITNKVSEKKKPFFLLFVHKLAEV